MGLWKKEMDSQERQKILELIKNRPKHYAHDIKKDTELLTWVKSNSLFCSDNIAEMTYSAVHQVGNVCEHGKIKQFDRFSTGFKGCGPANICECTKKSIAASVSSTKSEYTSEKHQEINSKRKETMLSLYGVEHNLQRTEVKEKITRPKIDYTQHSLLSDCKWLYSEYIEKKRTLVDIADELGVYYGTVGDYCRKHGFDIRSNSNYSLVERQVRDYIQTLLGDVEIIENDRKLSDGKHEIDIYVPSHKIGVEINGLFWHSWNPSVGKPENRNYHKDKTDYFSDIGIQILHITDSQWNTQREIVCSLLKSKLGMTEKLYARKCRVVELDSFKQKEFFDSTHLQGYVPAAFSCGLEFGGEIVSAISVSKSRIKPNDGHELVRFSTKLDTTVIGGLSKLLAHARKTLNIKKMTSYCDRDISNGKGYLTVGFTCDKVTEPGYFWTDGTNIHSRQKCQRAKLKYWLPDFDESLSEARNMFANGYRRYWNSGNFLFKIEF